MTTIYIDSVRGTKIPVSVYGDSGENGLLLMAHSFISNKEEDGRYVVIGEEMARQGYLCLSPDFPGNGTSQEPFKAYSLRSCLDDLESVYQYASDHYEISGDKALLGYSMGGRLVPLFQERHPEFKKMAFWAAAVRPYGLEDRFLEQELKGLKEEGDETGICHFHDIFNDVTLEMSADLINDLIEMDVLKALEGFDGEALIIQGDKDITIEVSNADLLYEHLVQAKDKKLVHFPYADHGFGLWDGRDEDNKELLDTTLSFLKKDL